MNIFKLVRIVSLLAVMLLPAMSFSDDYGGRGQREFPFFPETRFINIRGARSGDTMTDVRIEPFGTMHVDRFTRMWWQNLSDTPIKIKFVPTSKRSGKGGDCQKIVGGSQMDSWNPAADCYITATEIPPNGALLIYLDAAGQYEYEVQFLGTKSTAKGELVVY